MLSINKSFEQLPLVAMIFDDCLKIANNKRMISVHRYYKWKVVQSCDMLMQDHAIWLVQDEIVKFDNGSIFEIITRG